MARTSRDIPTIIVTREPNPARARLLEGVGIEVLAAPSARDALVRLRELEIRSLLVEGGAGLAGALLTDDLVDRVIIFQSPIELGSGALGAFEQAPPGFATALERRPIIERRSLGDNIMTTYALHEIPCSPD